MARKQTPWKQQHVKTAKDVNSMLTAYLAIYKAKSAVKK